VAALRTLEEGSFPVVDILPQPHLSFPKLENLTPSYELPVVLVPPAVIEIKDDSDMRSAPKPGELPSVYLRVFETEVCSRIGDVVIDHRCSLLPAAHDRLSHTRGVPPAIHMDGHDGNLRDQPQGSREGPS
jgi:hypothetical protein